MLSIKWFLGNNSNRFFLKYKDTIHVCGNESMPILKHKIQDKDKLRYNKECVKTYQEDKSLTYILFQLI